jgi:hypothetical protein
MQLAKDHERVALGKATARRRQDWRLLDEAASLRRAADIRAPTSRPSQRRAEARAGCHGRLGLRPDQHPENSIGKIKLCRGFMP